MEYTLYSLPFSFNGPCASLSGAGFAYNAISKRFCNIQHHLLTQSFDESASQYLQRIKTEISISRHSLVYGGNHLSCLPLHEIASERGLCRIILDAHRDYTDTPVTTPTHANFLNLVGNMEDIIFYGYRDGIFDPKCPAKQFRYSEHAQLETLIKSLPDDVHFYIDIDLDVLDPSVFPATGCPIPNGLYPKDIKNIFDIIGQNRIDIISFEEYIPLMDDNNQCLNIITDLFQYIVERNNDESATNTDYETR